VELCESGSKTTCGHGSESSNRVTAASKTAGDHGSESLNRATVVGSGGLGRRQPDLLEQGDDNSTRGDVGIDAAQGGAARWVMAVATQRRVRLHGSRVTKTKLEKRERRRSAVGRQPNSRYVLRKRGGLGFLV
jgi:hypothetical protein